MEQTRKSGASIEEQRSDLGPIGKPIGAAAIGFNLFGDVLDTKGCDGSLQQTIRMSLDEGSVANAAVKVA